MANNGSKVTGRSKAHVLLGYDPMAGQLWGATHRGIEVILDIERGGMKRALFSRPSTDVDGHAVFDLRKARLDSFGDSTEGRYLRQAAKEWLAAHGAMFLTRGDSDSVYRQLTGMPAPKSGYMICICG